MGKKMLGDSPTGSGKKRVNIEEKKKDSTPAPRKSLKDALKDAKNEKENPGAAAFAAAGKVAKAKQTAKERAQKEAQAKKDAGGNYFTTNKPTWEQLGGDWHTEDSGRLRVE